MLSWMAGAFARSRIRKRLPRFRDKLPNVMPGRQRQLNHALCIRVPHFAVSRGKSQRIVAAAAGSHNNLANTIHRIGIPFRILGCEPFVRMFMPREDQGGMSGIKVLPKYFQFGMDGVTLEHAATEERVMPVGDDARVGMRRQILPKPLFLGRASAATTEVFGVAVRVQRYDMPRSKVVTVISLAHWPRLRSPVLKIARSPRFGILVIA